MTKKRLRELVSSTPPPNGTTAPVAMARQKDTALVVVGLLLILAHCCATQAISDLRTVGVGGGVLPSSSSFLNSYDSNDYNRLYNSYPYGSSGYYNNYPTGVYSRQVPNAVPGCQSGLFNSGQPSSSGSGFSVQASNTMQEQQTGGQTKAINQIPSDPNAAQTISTSTSNVQHQHMRAADNMWPTGFSDGSVSNTRLVPSQLHYIDPSQYSSRQTIPLQRRPSMELTYNPEDMVKLYGAGNFQPPVFSLWKRQSPTFRGLSGFQQFGYPPIDYRFINGGQQQFQQRPLEHPVQKLRQASALDHANQPLPPNVYRAGKWEPVTNLHVENPVNLAEFENVGYGIQGPAGYSMQGAHESSSTPLCREKRQIDPSWMYQLADWSNYDSRLAQQRAAATLPGLTPPPLTPYHGPFAPLSEIFPSGQPLGAGQMYSPGFTNPQAKGAVEGIQHFVTGIAQMVPMFSGAAPLYR